MSGGGSLSVGPPMSKFCSDLGGFQRYKQHETLVLHTAGSERPNNDLPALEALQMYPSQI